MRLAIAFALLALAACGQNATPTTGAATTTSATSTTSSAPITVSAAPHVPLTGYVLGYGDGWRLDIGREIGHILVTRIEDGASWGGDYAPPTQTAPGKYRFASDGIEVLLEEARCTHDVAVFPFRATIHARAHEDTTGCAVERWDYALVALMPQIDACIAATNERRVSFAGPRDGLTLVRVSGESGAFDCRVSTANVVVKTNRDESLRIAGEARAIFVRAPGPQPGGECFEAPEVRGADGALLGWMDDPDGC